MSDQVTKLKQQMVPILQKNGVIKSAIFGSYARGSEDTNSDVDLLVELPQGATLIDLVGLKQDLEEVLLKKVDVVTYDALNKRIRSYVQKDLITIYG